MSERGMSMPRRAARDRGARAGLGRRVYTPGLLRITPSGTARGGTARAPQSPPRSRRGAVARMAGGERPTGPPPMGRGGSKVAAATPSQGAE